MRLKRGFPARPGRGRVVTLGVFDGVHRGHARLLAVLRRQADRTGLPAAVVTFDDHPHGTLAPEQRPPRLALDSQRLDRMRSLGVDEVFLVRFTQALADMPAEEFVRRRLTARLGARHVVVGADFVFGRGAAGTIGLLRRLGRESGFGVTKVPALREGGRIISSTAIRRAVAAGDVDQARRWLGWAYALHGRVVRGARRGTAIGLPTANLQTVHEIVPAPGVYAVLARLLPHSRDEAGGRRGFRSIVGRGADASAAALEETAGSLKALCGEGWPALCHIGITPTFHAFGPETIEVHIPGWTGGALYGRRMEVQFLGRLRGTRKFKDAAALLRQVGRDLERARRIWRGW